MIRISTIFIAVCMVLIAASLGIVVYYFLRFDATQSAVVSLAALTVLILYNAISMRLRDRSDVGSQIADLSRGTADLARQVAEFGRRLAALETKNASEGGNARASLEPLSQEITELGSIVRQLAASVAAHDDALRPEQRAASFAMPGDSHADAHHADFDDSSHDESAFGDDGASMSDATATAPRRIEAIEVQHSPAKQAAPAASRERPASDTPLLATRIRAAIESNRLDLYLQPLVTLPQRKVRFYEAVSRLRDETGGMIAASDFVDTAENIGMMPRIDHMVVFRCVQVLRRLQVKTKDVGLFCNMSRTTIQDPAIFRQCLDFLEANRVLAPALVFEFKQDTLRNMVPMESEHLAKLAAIGFRFSLDHVHDLRIDPRELADLGVKFVKVPARMLLDSSAASLDIHPADLSDLLGRHGIDLVAEKIEGEKAVVDLLDYDVRYGQGFLFAPPRPLRQENAAQEPAAANVGAPAA